MTLENAKKFYKMYVKNEDLINASKLLKIYPELENISEDEINEDEIIETTEEEKPKKKGIFKKK